MSRLFGYFANQTDRLRCALTAEASALAFGGDRADGYGFGSYQFGEVLLRRKPLEPRDTLDLPAVVRELRTGCLVAHARDASHGARMLDNTQPFRHRHWVFAMAGALPGGRAQHGALRDTAPDHLARTARGDTDAEAVFVALLGVLHRRGSLEDHDLDRSAMAAALFEALDVVDGVCGASAKLNLVLTHGRAMAALRRGPPMAWARRNGLRDCEVCRRDHEVPGRAPHRVDHDTLRYVMLSGDTLPEGRGWSEVPSMERGAALVIGHDLDARVDVR